MPQTKTRHGLTLIELMILIFILGILAALVLPRCMRKTTPAAQYKHRIEATCIASDGQAYSFQVTDYQLGVEANRFVLQDGSTKLVQERCSILDKTYR